MKLKFRDPFNMKIQVLTANQIIQSVKPLFYVTGMKTCCLQKIAISLTTAWKYMDFSLVCTLPL